MLSPWVIGILSTDYDLHEHRNALVKRLKKDDVHVSAFELPSFPVEPTTHSHDSCLRALERTDIVILVVDKRYGGIYYDSSKTSITEAEYMAAIEAGKPCLVFVSEKAWDEAHRYKVEYKARKATSEDKFDKKFVCTYVTDIRTIHFIHRLQKAYDERKASNWITQFDGIDNLCDNVIGKLYGLSRYWLEKIVDKQVVKLKARKTSTGFSMSLEDVFDRGYYVEPNYEVESGSLTVLPSLDAAINDALIQQRNVLVYGDAGYGKTTILARSFFSHVETIHKEKGYCMPMYIWLKDKTSGYHFDVNKYISDSFAIYLNVKPYPYLSLTGVSFFFYLDGFDEIAEHISLEKAQAISQASILQYPFLLTSRTQYAQKYLNHFDLANQLNVRIHVQKWTREKASEYIQNFCSKKADESFAQRVNGLIAKNADLSNMLDNPLLVTMLLWIIEANRLNLPETITSRVQLFQECLREMARRELHRVNIKTMAADELVQIWARFAWLVYHAKLRDSSFSRKRFSTLKEEYQSSYDESLENIPESLFEVVFDIQNDSVYGTLHEQFLEFLVALSFYHACLKEIVPYPEFLKYVVRPEINRYFRALWEESDEKDQETVAERIQKQYVNNINKDDEESIRTRVHAVYHLSRLNSKNRDQYLLLAFSTEKNISVLLSLYFGAIKMGNLDKEEEFFQCLEKSEEYNVANRGYHLAYYADSPATGMLPFVDDGRSEWTNTLKAFLRHFRSDNIEQYYLRRIDLTTIYQLMQSRDSVNPMTQSDLEEIRQRVYAHPGAKDSFQQKIEAAYKKVETLFTQLSSAATS